MPSSLKGSEGRGTQGEGLPPCEEVISRIAIQARNAKVSVPFGTRKEGGGTPKEASKENARKERGCIPGGTLTPTPMTMYIVVPAGKGYSAFFKGPPAALRVV